MLNEYAISKTCDFFIYSATKFSFSVDNFFESNILRRKKNPSYFMLIFVFFWNI